MIDPYRTLGLQPGAPMAEVKKAYRRLAKAYHPDSAGEAALPRFLAIHEAYESIRTGRPIRAVRHGDGATPGSGPGAPWRADPDRARAAREQARRRAGSRSSGGAPGASDAPGGASGPRPGAATPGAASSGTDAGPRGGSRSGSTRAGAGGGRAGASGTPGSTG